MSASQLTEALDDLRITQAEFARLLSVTPRAVVFWVNGSRRVPGPVQAYLRLLMAVPVDVLMREMRRRKRG